MTLSFWISNERTFMSINLKNVLHSGWSTGWGIYSPATGESFRMTHHLDFHFFPSRNLTVPSITELVSVIVSLCTSHYMYYTTPNVTTSRTSSFTGQKKLLTSQKAKKFWPRKEKTPADVIDLRRELRGERIVQYWLRGASEKPTT